MNRSVYLMQRADGAIKVGMSKRPKIRAYALTSEIGEKVSLVFSTEIRRDARSIEFIAHKLLKEKHDVGEWFWATQGDFSPP